MILVKITLFLRHIDVCLPGLRDHHHHGFLQASARHQQKFKHIIEDARIGIIRLYNREKVFNSVAELFRPDDALAGGHIIFVATEGIDFAVVAHEAVWLRSIPAWKSIGGESAMNHRQMALVVRVFQVRIEREQLAWCEHALIDNDSRIQATDINLVRFFQV